MTNNTLKYSIRSFTAAFAIAGLLVAPASFAQTSTDYEATPNRAGSSSPSVQAPKDVRRPRVGEIDPSEKDKYRTRYEAKNSTVFSFGPGFSNNLNSSKTLYSVGFGYEWEVGSQNAVIAQLNGSFGESTAYIDGIIGGKYYFSDEDFSPFAKAGFGFGTSKGQDLDNIGGFAGMLGAGATVFRTSSTHLELGITYSTLFAKNALGNPNVTAITLGILF
jgi:hypothetical protein